MQACYLLVVDNRFVVSICIFVYSRGLNRNINTASPLTQPNKADQSNTTEASGASDEYAFG